MRIKAAPSFIRQANKVLKRNSRLKNKFKQAIEKLINDPFEPSLKTHKLKGDLKEFWSCSVNYETRLRFKIIEDAIELMDIGPHDEVY